MQGFACEDGFRFGWVVRDFFGMVIKWRVIVNNWEGVGIWLDDVVVRM